eukprot:gene4213-5190_t
MKIHKSWSSYACQVGDTQYNFLFDSLRLLQVSPQPVLGQNEDGIAQGQPATLLQATIEPLSDEPSASEDVPNPTETAITIVEVAPSSPKDEELSKQVALMAKDVGSRDFSEEPLSEEDAPAESAVDGETSEAPAVPEDEPEEPSTQLALVETEVVEETVEEPEEESLAEEVFPKHAGFKTVANLASNAASAHQEASAKLIVTNITGGRHSKNAQYRIDRAKMCLVRLEELMGSLTPQECARKAEAMLDAMENCRSVQSAVDQIKRWKATLSILEELRAPFSQAVTTSKAMAEAKAIVRVRSPLTELERANVGEAELDALSSIRKESRLTMEQRHDSAESALVCLEELLAPLTNTMRLKYAEAKLAVQAPHNTTLDRFLLNDAQILKVLEESIAPLTENERMIKFEAGLKALENKGHKLSMEERHDRAHAAYDAIMQEVSNLTEHQRAMIAEARMAAVANAKALNLEQQQAVAQATRAALEAVRPLNQADIAAILQSGVRALIRALKLTPQEREQVAMHALAVVEQYLAPVSSKEEAERMEAATIAILISTSGDPARQELAISSVQELNVDNSRAIQAEQRLAQVEAENAGLKARLSELELMLANTMKVKGSSISLEAVGETLNLMISDRYVQHLRTTQEACNLIGKVLQYLWDNLHLSCYVALPATQATDGQEEVISNTAPDTSEVPLLEYLVASESNKDLLHVQLDPALCTSTYEVMKLGKKKMIMNAPKVEEVHFWKQRENRLGDFCCFPLVTSDGKCTGVLAVDTLEREEPKGLSQKEQNLLESLTSQMAEGLRFATRAQDERARNVEALVNSAAANWSERLLKISELNRERRRIQELLKDGTIENKKCVAEMKTYKKPARSIASICSSLLRICGDPTFKKELEEYTKGKWSMPQDNEIVWQIWDHAILPGLKRLIEHGIEKTMLSVDICSTASGKAAKDAKHLLNDISSWNFRGSFILKCIYPWIVAMIALAE